MPTPHRTVQASRAADGSAAAAGGALTVAIHQPNYAPWLGYFAKMAASDLFVFLDDAQYSKNNYINRVQVLGPAGPRWLTVPVSHAFGAPITEVRPARPDWKRAHLDSLRSFYRKAPCFAAVWPEVEAVYEALGDGSLADINIALVTALADRLAIRCRFHRSSAIDTGDARAGDRLVALVRALAPGGTYLSGRGGAKYQDPEAFARAGLSLRYRDFAHPVYPQTDRAFAPGLSVLDALFHIGWSATADLLAPTTAPAIP